MIETDKFNDKKKKKKKKSRKPEKINVQIQVILNISHDKFKADKHK